MSLLSFQHLDQRFELIRTGHIAGPVTMTTIYLTVVASFGFVLNCAALFLFIRDRDLHTAFNIHIIHLLALNTVTSFTVYLIGVLNGIYSSGQSRWWMGDAVCNFYMFCFLMSSAVITNTYGVLALNRAWAVLSPMTFRRHHSKRFTYYTITGVWLYILLVIVPLYSMDVAWYRLTPVKFGCALNRRAQMAYATTTAVVIWSLPVLLVWLSVVIVLYRVRCSRRIRVTALFLPSVAVVTRTRRAPRQYVILMMLTVSVTICYSPRVVYAMFGQVSAAVADPAFALAASMLYSGQLVVDPIILALSQERIRRRLMLRL